MSLLLQIGEINLTELAIILPLIAIVVSFSALTVAVLNYRRKSSFRIRGTYGLSSSVYGEDSYVSSIMLENLKDRAITIFGIYLRVGYNVYIKIEEFEEAPLIIKPFETWSSEYGPLDFYAANLTKVDLNEILNDRKISQRLVISSSEGKYVVKEFHKAWDPVAHYLVKNRLTMPVYPMRLLYKGKSFGGKTKFVVAIDGLSPETLLKPVLQSDIGSELFSGVDLTQESLTNATKLEQFLKKKQKEGKLVGATIKVIEASSLRRDDSVFDGKERKTVESHGFLLYNVVGPLILKFDNLKSRKKNKKAVPDTQYAVQNPDDIER